MKLVISQLKLAAELESCGVNPVTLKCPLL
jgi:hypothetical protein